MIMQLIKSETYHINNKYMKKGETMQNKWQLDNGVRIVTEKIPHFRSVSVGVWFSVGSVYENEEDNGMSHFLEHILFKGTKTRTAKEIAQAMDSVGGQLNAFTAKECTCYYSNVMDEHLPLALDILSDMVMNSIMDPVEIEKEKGVILEEILMYEDSPEDLVAELLDRALLGNHPLANPILGNQQFIQNIARDKLLSFLNEMYSPHNTVISIAGNFNEDQVMELTHRYFDSWKNNRKSIDIQLPAYQHQYLFKWKDIEQIHLCFGYPGITLGNNDIYPLMILNNIFGGGMSSRLFQNIREERGLVYSIFSYPSLYTCGGKFTIYACMKPDQARNVADLIIEEIKKIRIQGITRDEFETARNQLKGNYILGLESSSNRMNAIGRSELLQGTIKTPDEILEKIDKTTIDDVIRIANDILDPYRKSIAVVGRENVFEGSGI